MSNLTELLPAGGSGKTVDFVASGTLPNGSKVVLKADGTVEAVGIITGDVTYGQSMPSGSAYTPPSSDNPQVEFINSTTFIYAYGDMTDGYKGKAVIGTVSGTVLSFGTPTQFYSSRVRSLHMSVDPSNRTSFVLTYANDWPNYYPTVIAGSISGSTISFGSATIYSSYNTSDTGVAFDPNATGKCILLARQTPNSEIGLSYLCTVSGVNIVVGSPVTFKASYADYFNIVFHPSSAGKFLLTISGGKIKAGSYSGSTISYGSEDSVVTGWGTYQGITYVPGTANKYIWAYRASGTDYGNATVITVDSFNNISKGSVYTFRSSTIDRVMVFSNTFMNDSALIYYSKNLAVGCGSTSYFVPTAVSGTNLSYSATADMFSSSGLSGVSSWTDVSFDPDNPGKFIMAASAYNSSCADTGLIRTGQMGGVVYNRTAANLTTDNFLGTATKAYSDTEEATILLQGGISTNQSGLTIGSDYYVQPDGTLSTTAGTPSVKLGKALSSTTVLLSGE